VPYWSLPLRLSEVFAQAHEKKGQKLQCCPGAPTPAAKRVILLSPGPSHFWIQELMSYLPARSPVPCSEQSDSGSKMMGKKIFFGRRINFVLVQVHGLAH